MVIPAVALALTHLGKITFVVESSISVVLFILYIFGVGFVTFGTGPATAVGNLYFSMWIGFSISFFIVSDSLHQYLDASGRGSPADGGEEHAPAPVLEDIEQTGGGATEGIEVTK
jgi:ABC-type Co2+ transport system permease subunit